MRKGPETGPVPPLAHLHGGPPSASRQRGCPPDPPAKPLRELLPPGRFKIPLPISDKGLQQFTHCKDKGTGSDEKEVTDDEEGDHTGAHHEPVLPHPHAQGTGTAHPEAHPPAPVTAGNSGSASGYPANPQSHPPAPVTPARLYSIVYQFPRIGCIECKQGTLLLWHKTRSRGATYSFPMQPQVFRS